MGRERHTPGPSFARHPGTSRRATDHRARAPSPASFGRLPFDQRWGWAATQALRRLTSGHRACSELATPTQAQASWVDCGLCIVCVPSSGACRTPRAARAASSLGRPGASRRSARFRAVAPRGSPPASRLCPRAPNPARCFCERCPYAARPQESPEDRAFKAFAPHEPATERRRKGVPLPAHSGSCLHSCTMA